MKGPGAYGCTHMYVRTQCAAARLSNVTEWIIQLRKNSDTRISLCGSCSSMLC